MHCTFADLGSNKFLLLLLLLKQIILVRVAANLKMAEWNVSDNVTTLNKTLGVQPVYLAEYTNTWPALTASKNRCVHFLHYCVMRLCDVRM